MVCKALSGSNGKVEPMQGADFSSFQKSKLIKITLVLTCLFFCLFSWPNLSISRILNK